MIVALFTANVWFFLSLGGGNGKGDWVVIEVNSKQVHRLPLSEDRVVEVNGPIGATRIEIRDGKAHIARSPCKNKVCIKSGFIQYADRLVACLPNKLVVRIEGQQHRGLDAVVG